MKFLVFPFSLKANTYVVMLHHVIGWQVTKREVQENWKNWKWRSSKDLFLNGAYFVPSGFGSCAPNYSSTQSFTAAPASMVPAITINAGPTNCVVGRAC